MYVGTFTELYIKMASDFILITTAWYLILT